MEKDDELKGSGNSYDFGARIYDPSIGRWIAVDPLAKKYAHLSPYCYVANSPIIFIDPDGRIIENPYEKGTDEYKKVQRAIDIVRITNPELFEIVDTSPIIFTIELTKLQTIYEKYEQTGLQHDPSNTGVVSSISMTTTRPGYSREEGFVTNLMYGMNRLQENEDGTYSAMVRQEDGSHKLTKLTEAQAAEYVDIEPNQTILLNEDLNEKNLGRVLAHELGHAKFTLLNRVKAFFMKKAEGYNYGHDPDNPSGEETEIAEQEFKQNYKEAKEKLD